MRRSFPITCCVFVLASLAACRGGGGGGAPPPPPVTYTIGGTVSGLAGTGLVLQNNGGNNLAIMADGVFSFSTPSIGGAAYAVTVQTRPSAPSQTCVVVEGSGNVQSANVTNVRVVCRPAAGRFFYVTADAPAVISGFVINGDTGALSAIPPPASPSGSNPRVAAAHPSGAFVYTPNFGSGNVSAFTIDASTGVLTELSTSPFPVGTNPTSLTFRSDGSTVYIPHYPSSLSAFTVDTATGALTPVAGSPFTVGDNPGGSVIDSSGRFLYVPSNGSASNELFGFEIAAATGVLTPVPGSPFVAQRPNYIIIEPTGAFLYASMNDQSILAFRIDAGTGALTPVAGSPFAAGAGGGMLKVAPSGNALFAANTTSLGLGTVSAFAIDSVTGALSASGAALGVGSGTVSFGIDSTGAYLYAIALLATGVQVASIDPATGALTLIDTLSLPFTPASVVLDRSGLFAYVAQYGSNSVHAYSINPVTLEITAQGSVVVGPSPREGVIVGSQ